MAHQLRVAVPIDIVADSTEGGVKLDASRVTPPNGLRPVRTIQTRDRVSAARLLAAELVSELRTPSAASEAPCAYANLFARELVDRQPIYLSKDLESIDPKVATDSTSPSAGFVVGSDGWVIPESFTLEPGTAAGFADAARLSTKWQFLSALSGACPIAAQVWVRDEG